MVTSGIDRAIASGVRFLRGSQLPHGELRTFRSSDPAMATDCELDSSPFVTAWAVSCLRFIDGEDCRRVKAAATRFLLSEMEGPGLWRYWSSRNAHHKHIPPDLDDICCVSHALAHSGESLPRNLEIVLANRNKEGLFLTWILPRAVPSLRFLRATLREAPFLSRGHPFWKTTEAAPSDVDCVVNANAVRYLGERAETRAAVRYLLDVVAAGRETQSDKWYLDRVPVHYMISRAVFDGVASLAAVSDTIEAALGPALEGVAPAGAVETAMALSTLLNLHRPPRDPTGAIDEVVRGQRADGAWPRRPIYFGGPRRIFGWGSEELSTALCLEALARCRDL